MAHYDAIVLGVGGMGSAAVYHLAARGRRVLGIERFDIPHEMGSSHGVTRIIRLAYYNHPSYVPLLRRAYSLWREIEHTSGERLLHITGSVDAGPPDSAIFQGSLRSCHLHDLPHEVLDGAQLARRFPGYHLPASSMAVLQPDGGFLTPERCIVAYVNAALALGAEIHGREQVTSWEPRGSGVEVRTDRATYTADRLVIAAGAWAGAVLPGLAPLAQPERQVLAWFQPRRPECFTPQAFPVFVAAVEEGHFYGLPVYGVPGFKVGKYHHLSQRVDPDQMDRACHPEDERVLRSFADRYFPDASGPTMALKTCLFTNSPDEHFLLDLLPGLPQVSIMAGSSGHGFKFCSVIGEILADLAIDGGTSHDISLFRLSRLAQ